VRIPTEVSGVVVMDAGQRVGGKEQLSEGSAAKGAQAASAAHSISTQRQPSLRRYATISLVSRKKASVV